MSLDAPHWFVRSQLGVLGGVASGAASGVGEADNADVPGLVQKNHTAGGAAIGLGVASVAVVSLTWGRKW